MTAGRDVEIAPGEAQAGRERRWRFERPVDVAIRSEAHDATTDERNPDRTLLVERHPIWVAKRGHVYRATSALLVVEDDDALPARVTQVDRGAVTGARDPIRMHDVAEHDRPVAVEGDPPQLPRNR